MKFTALAVAAASFTLVACGEETPATHSASDEESGLSVSVAGDQVTIKRTQASESGTGGKAGQVYCTNDYAKLMSAQEQPAPSQPWYAASLITWPEKAKETTATLSHALDSKPDLCVAQATDGAAQAIVYFDEEVKTEIEKQQADGAREQQAASAEEVLSSASSLAVSAMTEDDAFPAADALVTALTDQGLIVEAAADEAAATETGTLYVLTEDTTDKQVVLAIKDAEGKVSTATQKRTGDPEIS